MCSSIFTIRYSLLYFYCYRCIFNKRSTYSLFKQELFLHYIPLSYQLICHLLFHSLNSNDIIYLQISIYMTFPAILLLHAILRIFKYRLLKWRSICPIWKWLVRIALRKNIGYPFSTMSLKIKLLENIWTGHKDVTHLH